jgi:hypothetical protein
MVSKYTRKEYINEDTIIILEADVDDELNVLDANYHFRDKNSKIKHFNIDDNDLMLSMGNFLEQICSGELDKFSTKEYNKE